MQNNLIKNMHIVYIRVTNHKSFFFGGGGYVYHLAAHKHKLTLFLLHKETRPAVTKTRLRYK